MTSPEGNHRLRSSISGLLDSGLYTDATIECGGKSFRVHKAVICSQSEYFARAFNEHTGFKEANTGTVVLQEVHSSTVQAIIEYLYHGKYSTPESLDERLTLIVDIYTAAEMYQLGALKTVAARDFRGISDSVFALATFPAAVKTIYQGTVEQDRGLRDTLVTAAVQQLDRLLLNSAFNEVLEESGAFAKDLIHGMKWHQHKTVRVQCYKPNCYYQITLLTGNLEEETNMLRCDNCDRAYGVGKWIVLPSVPFAK